MIVTQSTNIANQMTQTFIRQNFRMYPTKEQAQYLVQDIGNQRFVRNHIVMLNDASYACDGKFIFYSQAAKILNDLKAEFNFLKIGNSQALQQTLKDYEQTLKTAIKNVKQGTKRSNAGFPIIHHKGNGGSVRYPQHCSIIDRFLHVPKMKKGLYVRWDKRSFPEIFKSVTIKLTASGKWYVSFVVPYELPDKVQINENSKTVGIDLNSKYFAVLSTGEAVKNPKHIKQSARRLKQYQRKMSKKFVKGQKQSKNYEKSRKRYSKYSEHITNQRKDFVHQLTTDIVNIFDIISIEDLNVKAMQQWNGSMILSAPFGMFRNLLTWKVNKRGKHLVVIGRFTPTSKVCNECGQIHKIDLKQRWMNCDCGASLHRDHNAAINILSSGLHLLKSNTVGITEIKACEDMNNQLIGQAFARSNWISLKQETVELKTQR